MLRRFAAALLLRRLSRDLARVADALDAQNALLARLADHVAPLASTADRATLSAATGVSHLDPDEVALAGLYVERTRAATGHTPDDEEVLIYLADEKTRDLAERLSARDEELARLAESRR